MWRHSTSTFAHEILWRASQSALHASKIEHDAIRPDHLAIQSLLCGFLAFEGFINLVGEEIAPDAWLDERIFFARSEFRGIEGKVGYIFSLFPETQLRKGEDPYQTFSALRRIRDALAHNRVYHVEELTEEQDPSFDTRWEAFDTPEKVEKGLGQLKALAEVIRLEALRLLDEDYQLSHLHYPAFGGPIASSTGTNSPNPPLQTPTSGTPAAGAPVAPPSGAAER
jgi:hypothetical protein